MKSRSNKAIIATLTIFRKYQMILTLSKHDRDNLTFLLGGFPVESAYKTFVDFLKSKLVDAEDWDDPGLMDFEFEFGQPEVRKILNDVLKLTKNFRQLSTTQSLAIKLRWLQYGSKWFLFMIFTTAKDTFDSIMIDEWPRIAGCIDFGLDDPKTQQERYEALQAPIRRGEISIEQLNAALGNGPALTKLVRSTKSNPHPDITFTTAWDELASESIIRPAGRK